MAVSASTAAFLIIIVGIIVFAALDMAKVKINIPYLGNITTGNETAKQYNVSIGEITTNTSVYAPLLYQNIRFGKIPILFYLDLDSANGIPWFNQYTNNVDDAVNAFGIWSNATNGTVSFKRTFDRSMAQITVDWNTSIPSNQTNARAVGEGGPTLLVDTGFFNLTLSGAIHILPSGTECVDVNRALHELGHVLGFDHTDDPSDIMFPYESCSRDITQAEVRTLKSLYSMPAKPQLAVSNITAAVSGGRTDINFSIENRGVVASPQTKAAIYSDGTSVASTDVASLKPGGGVFEFFSNARTYGSTQIRIAVDPDSAIDMWYRNLTYAVIPLQ